MKVTQPIDLYSYDVFDTLITRPYTRPVDLFLVLALDVLGPDSTYPDWQRFARERMDSESRARSSQHDRDDITLSMIYDEFKKSSEFSSFCELAMEREIVLELEAVQPIKIGIEKVRELLSGEQRVVFLSDMYLPKGVITEMLLRAGLAVDPESVYVSGDVGFNKHKGRLFDFVAEREGVLPNRCLHTGDNWKPDVLRPRQRGWQAVHFTPSALTRFERTGQRPNYWLATRAGGVSRAARLKSSLTKNEMALAGLASDVIGPFLTSFIAHVLLDAQSRGLNTLYFVSRDGQIFLKIARSLQMAGIAPSLDCRYLYGSRQAWFLASVNQAKREQLEWSIPNGVKSTALDVLRRLEIDRDDAVRFLLGLGMGEQDLGVYRERDQLESILDGVIASELAHQFLETAQRKRANLVQYLNKEGVFDPGRRYALVDVGWSLQCQSAFRACLHAEGLPDDVFGYYLGISKGHMPLEKAGRVAAFISYTGSELSPVLMADWFFKLATILLVEHAFTVADHPSVSGYEVTARDVEPTFKTSVNDVKLMSLVSCLHRDVVAYADFAGKTMGSELASHEFAEWSLENVRRLVWKPQAGEAAVIGWIPTNRDMSQDSAHNSILASPLSAHDLLRMVIQDVTPGTADHFSPTYAWAAGAAALSPKALRWTYWILRELGLTIGRIRRFIGRYRS